MNATIYGRGQMVIPSRARKEAGIGQGDVVAVVPEGDGRIVLLRLEKPNTARARGARLMRRKRRHPVIVGGPEVSEGRIREILGDFP